MTKFVLFGSTNETALHFIRHAAAANLKTLCLYPYEARKSYIDRHSLLISSLGGVPIRYNFRTAKSITHGYQGSRALQSLLKGVNAVVWAADPDLRQTTLSRPEERLTEYLEDLRNTFVALRELQQPRRFVCLTQHSIHEREGMVMDQKHWWQTYTKPDRALQEALSEQMKLIMNSEFLDWIIIRVGWYIDGIPPQRPEDRGIELGARPLDGVWRDDIAKTIVEALKNTGLRKTVLDVRSVPATSHNSVENVIGDVALSGIKLPDALSERAAIMPSCSSNKELISDRSTSLLPITSKPPIGSHLRRVDFTAADPILSTLHPKAFPLQFAQATQHDGDKARIRQLLEEVRRGRADNQMRFQAEASRNEELRKAREYARSEATQKGLPPPGTDVKMFRRLNAPPRKRPTKPVLTKPVASDLSSSTSTSVKQRDSPNKLQANTANATSTFDPVGATEIPERKSVLERLSDVLFDRSADYLSPHLATPVFSDDISDEGFHPRLKYSRSKIKRSQHRR